MMTRHSPAMPAVHAPKPKRRNLLTDLVRSREATLFVVLVALVAATAAVKPEFLNLQNLRDVLLNVSIIGLLTAGMTVVIQPNVITKDGRAGVQTGEMVLVTRGGIERLHTVPRGFTQV